MNAEQATAIVQLLTGTIEGEGAATRKVLAAVPNANRAYKPDPKSRTAWELAVHLAMSDIWFADSILNGKFEWTGEPPTPPEMYWSIAPPATFGRWLPVSAIICMTSAWVEFIAKKYRRT